MKALAEDMQFEEAQRIKEKIEVLEKLNTSKDVKEHLIELGYDDKQVKDLL